MKKEIPPAVLVLSIVLGVALIVGVWFMAGGNGRLAPEEKKLAEQQSATRAQREEAAAKGDYEGQGSEAAARAKDGAGN